MNTRQKKGMCGYPSRGGPVAKVKDCYWFGKDNVAGKNVGCYSR